MEAKAAILVAITAIATVVFAEYNIQSANDSYKQVIPTKFDARMAWPLCPMIGLASDQGCCASSYAIAPTSVMSDRACITSNGAMQQVYSSYHALQCCDDCGFAPGKQCLGGYPSAVWEYWVKSGLTTGGLPGLGCLPYAYQLTCTSLGCPPVCVPPYNKTVIADTKKGKEIYEVAPTVSDIKAELFFNGPVQTSIDLYPDFLHYKKGVYVSDGHGPLLGKQHVKLIGWGTENGHDFWLAVNSYGLGWGEMGLFKILQGHNHLGVEANVRAGRA